MVCTYMKRLIGGLTFLLLGCLTGSYAQPRPFEGANTVLINTDLADKEAYLTVGRVLSEQAIPFSVARDCLVISAPGFARQKDVVFVGQLSVNAGLVKLTGSLQEPLGKDQTEGADSRNVAVRYGKEKRNATLAHAGFLYLNELAKKLYTDLHGVISYKVVPQPME